MDVIKETLGMLTSSKVWCVAPCGHNIAFGVPLYGYFDSDGGFTSTAVTPLAGVNETASAAPEMFSMRRNTELSLLIDPEMVDICPAVVDNIAAHLAFKHITKPMGATQPMEHIDPLAGVLNSPHTSSAAVAIARAGAYLGVLEIRCDDGGAKISVNWIDPGSFTHSPVRFAELTKDLKQDHFLAGLNKERELLAVKGIEMLAQDPYREVPDLVMAAMLSMIVEGLPRTHEAKRRANHIHAAIFERTGLHGQEGIGYYLSAMSAVRSALKVIAGLRKPGKESAYQQAAEALTWRELTEALTQSLQLLVVMGGVDRTATVESVHQVLEGIAAGQHDPYTEAMATDHARFVSGIANAATSPEDSPPDENKVTAHVRSLLKLLGVFPWQASRPFDFGVLCAVIGS